MVGVSTGWLEFWQMTFSSKVSCFFGTHSAMFEKFFSKFWMFKTKLPYFANTYSSQMYLWELFASRKELFLNVITPLLLSLLSVLNDVDINLIYTLLDNCRKTMRNNWNQLWYLNGCKGSYLAREASRRGIPINCSKRLSCDQ